jgi:hypothetical protein
MRQHQSSADASIYLEFGLMISTQNEYIWITRRSENKYKTYAVSDEDYLNEMYGVDRSVDLSAEAFLLIMMVRLIHNI